MYDQNTANLNPDELIIRWENLEARKRITMAGLRNLQCAICLQAVADYKSASIGKRIDYKKPEDVMRECEMFFNEPMFKAATPDVIIRKG